MPKKLDSISRKETRDKTGKLISNTEEHIFKISFNKPLHPHVERMFMLSREHKEVHLTMTDFWIKSIKEVTKLVSADFGHQIKIVEVNPENDTIKVKRRIFLDEDGNPKKTITFKCNQCKYDPEYPMYKDIYGDCTLISQVKEGHPIRALPKCPLFAFEKECYWKVISVERE
jgi:hypothetical protein